MSNAWSASMAVSRCQHCPSILRVCTVSGLSDLRGVAAAYVFEWMSCCCCCSCVVFGLQLTDVDRTPFAADDDDLDVVAGSSQNTTRAVRAPAASGKI